MMATMDDMPIEILMKIFSFLTNPVSALDHLYHLNMSEPDCKQDFLSLCSAALVSRVWRQVAEDPSLWRRFVLVVHSTSDFATLDNTNRFSRVQTLVVKGVGETQVDKLRQLVECRNTKTVICTRLDFMRLERKHDFLRRVTKLKHFFVYIAGSFIVLNNPPIV